MEAAIVPVHTKVASTRYWLGLPGSYFSLPLPHRFRWVCYRIIDYQLYIYRVLSSCFVLSPS